VLLGAVYIANGPDPAFVLEFETQTFPELNFFGGNPAD
jgi:hypothetical protein